MEHIGPSGPGAALRRGGIVERAALPGPRYDPAVPAPTVPPAIPVQVFGLVDSRPTQAALRFFKERRVVVHFVDLRKKPIAPGELRRFVERLGARACVDEEAKAWKAAGLGYLRMDDAELAERLLADARLLRLPLVRHGHACTAGPAATTWASWLSAT
jgi:arsenate reductase-like glutaredoxin family protein